MPRRAVGLCGEIAVRIACGRRSRDGVLSRFAGKGFKAGGRVPALNPTHPGMGMEGAIQAAKAGMLPVLIL